MAEYVQTVWLLPPLATLAILAIGTAYWGYRDAGRHGSGRAAAWDVATLFLGFVGPAGSILGRRNPGPSAPRRGPTGGSGTSWWRPS